MYRGDQNRITYFQYDGHQLTVQIDGDSGVFSQDVFLDHSPVAYLVGWDTCTVHASHLDTPRIVTDENRELVWSADYDPFGKATITIGGTVASASDDAARLQTIILTGRQSS